MPTTTPTTTPTSPPTPPQPSTLLDSFCALFTSVTTEGLSALSRIPSLYDPRLVFHDPLTTTLGLDAFVALNRRMIERARSLSVEVVDAAQSPDGAQLFVTWRMHYAPRRGPALVIEGATHARVRDQLIVSQRDYWDLAGSLAAASRSFGPLWRRVTEKLV